MTAPGHVDRRAEGCTVVLCTATACRTALHPPLLSDLRAMIRGSRHGVLVTAGCVLGPLACHTRARGPLLLVQPCDRRREPVGCAVLVGPVRSDDDVALLGEWLRGGEFDPALLPEHLRSAQRAVHSAARN